MRQRDERGYGSGSPGAAPVQRQAAALGPGKRSLVEQVYGQDSAAPVQRRSSPGVAERDGGEPAPQIHAAAARGVAAPGGPLPHLDLIQRAFGARHDLSGVQAHVGGPAAAACDDMGANAYATGHHVAFRGAADLHTAAHEATHVVQQRGGVQLLGGVGAAGDPYEQQADQVADLVVRGESAAHVLDAGGGGAGAGAGAGAGIVQRDDRDDRRQERTDERRDRRTDREGDRDRRERRPEGGRERARSMLGDLESDWAGRAILERYLFGEGDWDISEERWSAYMMRSERLRLQLLPHIREIATQRTALPESIDSTPFPFAQTFAAEVENGEGIVGYQYLHGTNADVGGFLLHGTSTVTRGVGGSSNTDGTSTPGETIVEIHANYRWNDMIDPNPQYSTDRVKSVIAEIITLGQAQAYRISINWTATARVHLDSAGNITRIEGWPGEAFH